MINIIQPCTVRGIPRLEYRYFEDNHLLDKFSINSIAFYFRFAEYITINKIIFIKCSKI